jgi:O-succinylbenzoate synthase
VSAGIDPLRLERVAVRSLSLPLKHPFETSFGRTERKEFLLVEASAGGVTGYGECVADTDPFYLPETNTTVLHLLRDFLVPLAFGHEIAHPGELYARFSRVRGHEMAKAALEMAVWELAARRAGVPLYRILGGRGGHIEAGVSIGLQRDVPELLDRVEAERAAGYRRIKIKIKPGRDLALVQAIRERWRELPLTVDANSAYTLADREHLKGLDGYDLMLIEQPLAWDDIADHAVLQRELKTALCLDESIRSPDDARRALELGSCRIVNIKVGRVGGFAAATRVHDRCRERGAPVWCGGMLESGIGRLANVHLQTLPGFTLPGDTSASARYFDEDLIDPPVEVDAAGRVAVPEGEGIGHPIVAARLERATLFREEWKAP